MSNEVIEFWFSEAVSKLWFRSTPEFDQQLKTRFGPLLDQAVSGELDDWRQSAEGCLALVILLDQFPLNMFRGEARSFATEALSREIADLAIEQGFDRDMPARHKAFLYMPFMHSESLEDQRRALQLFDQPGLEDNLRFARHHYQIVEQFGRFPHRNAALGRDSTEAEVEYLNSKEAFTG